MAGDADPARFSLSRWSRRKLEAARGKADGIESSSPDVAPPAAAPVPPAVAAAAVAPAADAPAPELPPVESLSIDSDFTAFLKPEVDESTRRAALRRLFSDPTFNVMDGLDVYIDDYTKTTPIPDDVLKALAHARYIFDPPQTRLNALGYVEDVPEDETAVAKAADEDAAGEGEAVPRDSTAPAAASDPASAAELSPGASAGASEAGVDRQGLPPLAGADLAPAQVPQPPSEPLGARGVEHPR